MIFSLIQSIMKAELFAAFNLQTVNNHKQEAKRPKLILKQNSKDLNQIGLVLSSVEKQLTHLAVMSRVNKSIKKKKTTAHTCVSHWWRQTKLTVPLLRAPTSRQAQSTPWHLKHEHNE